MRIKLLKLVLVLFAGASLASCNGYDADAELTALEAEMDRLEKEDQHIREHFLERINSLRKKLTDLIAQVEADLKARIDEEGRNLLSTLNKKAASMRNNITKSFNESREYMNSSFTSCRGYISDSFKNLEKSRDALEAEIQKAIQNNEKDKLAKLMTIEGKLDNVTKMAKKVEAAIGRLEPQIAEAERFNSRINAVATGLDDLDEAFAEMEKNQLKLMQLVENEITDEYLASLSTAKLAEVKSAVAKAESLIDEMESYKDEMEDLASISEEMLSGMEDLENDFGSAVDDFSSLVDDCDDALSNTYEFWEYFENSDAEDHLAEIESLAEENISIYDETLEKIEEINSHVDTFYATVWDWEAQAHEFLQSAYDYGEEALDKYSEIESVRGW